MNKNNNGIFIVGHGTKSTEGIRQFIETIDQIRNKVRLPVGYGFIELAEPPIQDGIDQLIRSNNIDHLEVVPLLLLAAGHLKNDIPNSLSMARVRHPEVSFEISKDLSITTTLLQIIEDRVLESLAKSGSDKCQYTLLVGRGSTDPDANSDLYKIARLLSERGRVGEVQPSFISLALPDVTSSLDRLATLGASQIVVAPYFLYQGALLNRIYDQSKSWARSNKSTSILLAHEIGPDERVSDLIVDRLQNPPVQAMNCEMCLYRLQITQHEKQLSILHLHNGHHHS